MKWSVFSLLPTKAGGSNPNPNHQSKPPIKGNLILLTLPEDLEIWETVWMRILWIPRMLKEYKSTKKRTYRGEEQVKSTSASQRFSEEKSKDRLRNLSASPFSRLEPGA